MSAQQPPKIVPAPTPAEISKWWKSATTLEKGQLCYSLASTFTSESLEENSTGDLSKAAEQFSAASYELAMIHAKAERLIEQKIKQEQEQMRIDLQAAKDLLEAERKRHKQDSDKASAAYTKLKKRYKAIDKHRSEYKRTIKKAKIELSELAKVASVLSSSSDDESNSDPAES